MARAQKGWLFEDEDALRVAMQSGLVPSSAQSLPVKYWRGETSEIGVCPEKAFDRDATKKLKEAGVERQAVPDGAEKVRLWAALLSPSTIREDPLESIALFVATGQGALLDMLSELVRLGCDRCSYMMLDSDKKECLAMVRAHEPPYYSVAPR